MNIKFLGCAPRNFRQGRAGHVVTTLVIHVIDGSQMGCDATFLSNTLSLVRSAHYSVGRTGEIHQYVDEQDTAFHAGNIADPKAPLMKVDGVTVNPNFYTIGIEHEGRADDPWTDEMYLASSELMRNIAARHNLAPLTRQNVWMHREIFAKKSCPGSKCDIDKLIALASGQPLDITLINPPALITATKSVHVRDDRPSATSPSLRTLAAGESVLIDGIVPAGQNVSGNSLWYKLKGVNQFVWSGATSSPAKATGT